MRRSAEHVVIGAGVIGLAIARELARRGGEVVVLDRGAGGAQATHAAGGMLAPVSEAEIEPAPLVEFGLDSLARYAGFVAALERETGLGCGLRSAGTLWAALDRDDLAELRHLADTLAARGLAARELTAEAVREIEPHLSHRVAGGLLVAAERQVDPRRLRSALREAVARLGASIDESAEVDEVVVRDGRVRAVRGRGRDGGELEVETPNAVVAAGAWSTTAIRSPLAAIGLRPVKGQLVRVRGTTLLGRVVRSPRVYLVPRADGELLLGATMEEMGFDAAPTAGATLDLLRHAWEVLPGVYDLELAEVSVGLRSAVDDHLPVVGATDTAGLWAAFGHFRNGVLLAPATAAYLADWIESGNPPPALRPFAPARLAPGAARVAS